MHVESVNLVSMNLENSTNDRTQKGSIMNPHMLLKDYIGVWLETFKKNSIKSASYDRLLTSLAALDGFGIARMVIEDITFFDIQKYINELVDRGYALTTIKKQTRIVTAPLKQAAAMRVLPADPCCGYSCKRSLRERLQEYHQFNTSINETDALELKGAKIDVCN